MTHTSTIELYDQIEALIGDRSVYGRGRTPEATHFRNVVNPQIAAIRRELNRRKLPSRRRDYDLLWQEQATQEAADIADLADTQRSL